MKTLTLEEQRARILNLDSAEQENHRYFRRHRIRDYIPGQGIYYLGDYPERYSVAPTEYDYNFLKKLAENNVKLIQVHEEWNDGIRHLGADKYSCFDPEGMKRFVELAHSFGIRIIAYVSSCFLHEPDPDFRENFAPHYHFITKGVHYKYRDCSAGSPEWRNYVIPRTFQVMDEYGFDGIFNDFHKNSSFTEKGALHREPIGEYDPEIEDMLSLIYSEVKRRGGIYKIHIGGNVTAPCLDKVYDYLWIGEGVNQSETGIGKKYDFYVTPCQDKKAMPVEDPDEYFASVIPFLQFPLLTSCGRPMGGGGLHENVPYYSYDGSGKSQEYLFREKVGEYMKIHPDGPYVYSLWSSIPDDPEDLSRWSRYLSLYRPMVTENSVAYLELRECADILSPLPEKVYASMFVNEKKYLVLSNFTGSDYLLTLREEWKDRVTGICGKSFSVPHKKILFLEVISKVWKRDQKVSLEI